MLYFHNDYNEMCHERVLEKITACAGEKVTGYGRDHWCDLAAKLVRKACKREDLDVHFLVGGTQTNLTVIDACLRPHQGVISAETGHIHVHETGSIEACGHKILALPTTDGKISAAQVEKLMLAHLNDSDAEHTVQPKMVYTSNPTELGTIYYKEDLTALHDVCKKYGLYLFMDGARLGYGLTARDNDLTLHDLAELTDVFYIGGTKCGAMFGEAVVFSNRVIAQDFRYLIKQHGGMLAKGWLLGVQFATLMENNLYFDICKHANEQADAIRKAVKDGGYSLLAETTTNQVFPVLPDALLDKLKDKVTFTEQGRMSETTRAVRFCTSWATTDENVAILCDAILNGNHPCV